MNEKHPLLIAWEAFKLAGKQGRTASFCWENGQFVKPLVVCDAPKRTRPKCGARTRSGSPCRAPVCLKLDGSAAARCHLHGGKSTGPKSQAGRDAIAASNRRRKKSQPLFSELTPEESAMLDEIEKQIAARAAAAMGEN